MRGGGDGRRRGHRRGGRRRRRRRRRRHRRHRRGRLRGRSVFDVGQRGVIGINGGGTARQRRALPDTRRRYAPLCRLAAAVTRGGRLFVVSVMVLAGANAVGATAPAQCVGRLRFVLKQTRVVVVVVVVMAVRRTLWRRPCGRQVGRLLPDQSGRRQVSGRPRTAHGAVLVPADAAAAAAAAVQRTRTAAVRRPHGGCRIRSGQRGRRGRHCVHDRRRPRIQRGRFFSGTVRVVATIVVTIVTIVRRNDRHEPLARYMVSGKRSNTVIIVIDLCTKTAVYRSAFWNFDI